MLPARVGNNIPYMHVFAVEMEFGGLHIKLRCVKLYFVNFEVNVVDYFMLKNNSQNH